MVKTTTNNIELSGEGILDCRLRTKSALKKVYVLEQASALGLIYPDKKQPMLVDASRLKKTSLEGLNMYTDESNINLCSAMAIVTNSSFQKIMLNFWYSIQKKNCPVQVFVSKQEAKQWLLRYV